MHGTVEHPVTLEQINETITQVMGDFILEWNAPETRQRIADRLEAALSIPMKDVTTPEVIDQHGVAFEFESSRWPT